MKTIESGQRAGHFANVLGVLPVEPLVEKVHGRRDIFTSVYRHTVLDKPGLHVFDRPTIRELDPFRVTTVLHGFVPAIKK